MYDCGTMLNTGLGWKAYAAGVTNQGKVDLSGLVAAYNGSREIHITVKAKLSTGVEYITVKTIFLSDININASTDHNLFLVIGGGWHSASFNEFCEIMVYNYQLHLSAYTINGEDYRKDAKMWVQYRW